MRYFINQKIKLWQKLKARKVRAIKENKEKAKKIHLTAEVAKEHQNKVANPLLKGEVAVAVAKVVEEKVAEVTGEAKIKSCLFP